MIIDLENMDRDRIDDVILQDTKKILSLTPLSMSENFPDFDIDNIEYMIVSYIKDLRYIVNDLSINCKKELLMIIYDSLSYCMCRNKWKGLFDYIKMFM